MALKRKTSDQSEKLVEIIVYAMQEKKAEDIVTMDLRKIRNAFTDFFVICSANSDTQAEAIMTSIEEQVFKALQEDAWQKEGLANKEWILLDYVSVVAHIFRKDRREFYGLEELWGDAQIFQYPNP